MHAQDNGQPPGYQAPIFASMQNDQIVMGVPRPILAMIVLLCVGLWVLFRSWGALGAYVLLHGVAAYLTYRDPMWLPVLVERLRFQWRLFGIRHFR